MTIQELGSLGELVAAIATVATLAYLAVQIRQNTRMVAAQIADALRDSRNEVTRALAHDAETARQVERRRAPAHGHRLIPCPAFPVFPLRP